MATTLSKTYTKQPLDHNSILAMLKERGLAVADDTQAIQILRDLSYFRLAAYLRPMEADKTTHQYKPGANLETAVALYNFDRELRHLVFAAVQEIEISLRSRIINEFSLATDAFWFFDESRAVDKMKFIENINTLKREQERTKEDFIKDHFKKYGDDGFPPAWKLLEITSFGCLTKLYFNFSNIKAKKRVARSYSIPSHETLESWMKAVCALRNTCAHHARLWNRTMPVMPQMSDKLRGKWLTNIPKPANKFYAVASCMIYWLNAINPANTFVADFKTLLAKFPNVDTGAMGFPENWQDEPLWK